MDFLAAGDFDGDARTDLAIVETATAGQAEVQTFSGNGDATFRATAGADLEGHSGALAMADFDGDGRVDLAVQRIDPSGQSQVEILSGNGDGTFRATTPINTIDVNDPDTLVVGDFNGDGRTDFAVATVDHSQHEWVQIFLGNGNGDGTFRAQSPIDLGVGSAIRLLAGNFGGDPPTDIAVVRVDSSGQGILEVLSYRVGLSPLATIDLGTSSIEDIVAGDFDSDGRTDLAFEQEGRVTLLLSNGDGTFRRSSITPRETLARGPS